MQGGVLAAHVQVCALALGKVLTLAVEVSPYGLCRLGLALLGLAGGTLQARGEGGQRLGCGAGDVEAGLEGVDVCGVGMLDVLHVVGVCGVAPDAAHAKQHVA